MARTCLSSSRRPQVAATERHMADFSISRAIVNGVPCCMVLTCHWRVMTCRQEEISAVSAPVSWPSRCSGILLSVTGRSPQDGPLGKSRMGISFAISDSDQLTLHLEMILSIPDAGGAGSLWCSSASILRGSITIIWQIRM